MAEWLGCRPVGPGFESCLRWLLWERHHTSLSPLDPGVRGYQHRLRSLHDSDDDISGAEGVISARMLKRMSVHISDRKQLQQGQLFWPFC